MAEGRGRFYLPLLGAAVLAGGGWLALIACGVGMLMVPAAYVAALRLWVRRDHGPGYATSLGSAFVSSLVAGFGLAGAGVAGGVVASRLVEASGGVFSDTVGGALGFAMGVVAFGMVTAPLLRLPQYYVAAGRDARAVAGVAACLEQAAGAPVLEMSRAGLFALLFALPGILAIGFHRYSFVLLGALTTPLCAAWLARSAPPPQTTWEPFSRASVGLRLSAVSAAAAGVVSLVVCLQVLWVPLDAWSLRDEGRLAEVHDAPWLRPLPHRLPGTDVTLQGAPTGLRVEAADGGGAGFVRVWGGSEVVSAGLSPAEEEAFARGQRARVTLRTVDEHYATVCLDRHGVRCDDGYGERVDARVSRWMALPLLVALLLGLHLAWRALPELFRYATLRELVEEGEARGFRAVTGRLRWLDESAEGRKCDSRGRLHGPFLVEGRDVAVRSGDAPVRAIVPKEVALATGHEVTFVGVYASLSDGGFRRGALPPPARALLFAGSLADASAWAMARAAGQAKISLLAITVAEVVFAVSVALGS